MKVFTAKYTNKAKVEVYYHKHKVKGAVNADRIQLIIKPFDSKPRGWLMTGLEANDIIYGLSRALSYLIEDGVPFYDVSETDKLKNKNK
jgi:hypothetical protein